MKIQTTKVDILSVADVKKSMIEAIDAGCQEIDLSEIKQVDSSFLSALLSAKRYAAHKGQPLHFVNVPASVTSLAQLYGVTELL